MDPPNKWWTDREAYRYPATNKTSSLTFFIAPTFIVCISSLTSSEHCLSHPERTSSKSSERV